jgi:hypothetical protein
MLFKTVIEIKYLLKRSDEVGENYVCKTNVCVKQCWCESTLVQISLGG